MGRLSRGLSILSLAIVALAAAPSLLHGAENRDGIAVIIGNRDYGDQVPTVEFAHNDAAAMTRFVVDVLGFRDGNIIDLRNATKGQIEAVFGTAGIAKGKLSNWARPGKADIVVYYSGHGAPGLKDRRGYLLPVDADPNLAEITGYPVDVLYRNLAAINARSVTVFLDACFSGATPGGMLIRAASGISVTPKPPRASSKLTVLTAARDNQVASWDEGSRHGLFTAHLLEALYGAADRKRYGNGDGKVTVAEVKRYLDDEMSYQARRRYGREQTATVTGKGSIVLAAYPPGGHAPIDRDKSVRDSPPPNDIDPSTDIGNGRMLIDWAHGAAARIDNGDFAGVVAEAERLQNRFPDSVTVTRVLRRAVVEHVSATILPSRRVVLATEYRHRFGVWPALHAIARDTAAQVLRGLRSNNRAAARETLEVLPLIREWGVAPLSADPRTCDSSTRGWRCQTPEHDADHGETDEGDNGSGITLEVAGEAPVAADPGERSLHDPAFRQDHESVRVGALNDFQLPAAGRGDGRRHPRPLVAAVGEDGLDEGERTARGSKQLAGAVAILHVGGMDDDAQQQAECIDEDVALAPRDLLARIEALRVERSPPFCAPLALWLSITAADGLASRPSRSRTAT